MPTVSILLDNAKLAAAPGPNPLQAIAITGDRIVAVAKRDELDTLVGPDTQVINAGGRSVLPGLVDSHLHLALYALQLDQIDCATPSLDECLARVQQRAASAPPDAWVRGHGWNQNDWDGYGTADQLDSAAEGRPAYLTAKSLHAAWASRAALRQAGVDSTTPDPPGGHIQRDQDGHPTGILFECAMDLVAAAIPSTTPERLAHSLPPALDNLLRFGLTGVHDFDGPTCLRALQLLRQRGQLSLRVHKHLQRPQLDAARSLGLHTGFGDAWLRIGNLKVFADGALGPRTAWMLEAYAGEPTNLGLGQITGEELLALGKQAAAGGIALAVHAIGDRANREVLDAFAALRQFESQSGIVGLRHRMEHLQLLHPQDVPRPAQLGIIASMQPIHATSDMQMAERYWGSRAQHAYAWNSLLDTGATLIFGSDAPVETPNPFLGLHAAVTRCRLDGAPAPTGWNPAQRISLHQAVRAYTIGPATAAGTEAYLGRLAPGYLADLIVLDRDPYEVPPEELPGLRPVATMVSGVFRYRDF